MQRYQVTVNHPRLGDLIVCVDADEPMLAAERAEREAAGTRRDLSRFFAWRVRPLAVELPR